MPHQGDTAALRSTVEKRDLCFVLLQRICVEHGRCVGVGVNALSIVWLISNLGQAITVNANLIAVDDFETRLVGLAKKAVYVNLEVCNPW
jgi:hypothetical protein